MFNRIFHFLYLRGRFLLRHRVAKRVLDAGNVLVTTTGPLWEAPQNIASGLPLYRNSVCPMNTIDGIVQWSNASIPRV